VNVYFVVISATGCLKLKDCGTVLQCTIDYTVTVTVTHCSNKIKLLAPGKTCIHQWQTLDSATLPLNLLRIRCSEFLKPPALLLHTHGGTATPKSALSALNACHIAIQ
jgi:hypothetical protein